MKKRFLEAGKIVNTHGVRGEIKIQPWADSADFLKGFSIFYIDGKPFRVSMSRVHKGCLMALLDGISSVESAETLRDKIISIDRNDAHLAPGSYFLQDVIGMQAVDNETGALIGIVEDIMSLPSSDIFVVKAEREILIPNVPEFIIKVDLETDTVRVKLIEGM